MIKLACCGDNCNLCPRYIGTINNNIDALKEAAEIWYKIGWRDRVLSTEEMKCLGCSSVKGCKYSIKECCKDRQIDNCGYCIEIPCSKLKEIFEKNKRNEKISKSLLTKEEYDMLNAAFFMKKEYLNKVKQGNEKNR